MVIGGGASSYNPAVTLARFVNKDRARRAAKGAALEILKAGPRDPQDRVRSLCSSAFKAPALEILVQVVGYLWISR